METNRKEKRIRSAASPLVTASQFCPFLCESQVRMLLVGTRKGDFPIPSLTLPRFENSRNVEMGRLIQVVGGLGDFVEESFENPGENWDSIHQDEIISAPRERRIDHRSRNLNRSSPKNLSRIL